MLKRPRLLRTRASDLTPPAPAPADRDLILEAAIAQEAPTIVFQPQIDVRTGLVTGAEALARWTGESDAQSLFGRAAAAGLGERLSRLLQRKALRTAALWEGALAELKLSINLLPEDLGRDGYDAWLLGEVRDAGFDPSRLTVEITESALLADDAAVVGRLNALRGAGVRVAVDDFGTGYASLAYLSRLPLDILKIDRGLIENVVPGSRDRIVVRALIDLARELGLEVIVEGVESSAQLALLADWGCSQYQGFLGSRALTEAGLLRFVRDLDRVAA